MKSILIKCFHCGIVPTSEIAIVNSFLSDSYLEPKVCPLCNDEAILIWTSINCNPLDKRTEQNHVWYE